MKKNLLFLAATMFAWSYLQADDCQPSQDVIDKVQAKVTVGREGALSGVFTISGTSYLFAKGNWDSNQEFYDDQYAYSTNDKYTYSAVSSSIPEGWSLLNETEWNELMTRKVNGGTKDSWAGATVYGVPGLLLLPDNWALAEPSKRGTSSKFADNTYSGDSWTALENAGAVFLPGAGYGTNDNGGIDYMVPQNGYEFCAYEVGDGMTYVVGQISAAIAVRLVTVASPQVDIPVPQYDWENYIADEGTDPTTGKRKITAIPYTTNAFYKWEEDGDTNPVKLLESTPGTYTALFAPKRTVTLHDGATTTPIVVMDGCPVDLPEATKSGYKYIGWNTDPSAKTAYKDTYTPHANVDLYPIFQLVDITENMSTADLNIDVTLASEADITIANGATLTVSETSLATQLSLKSITIKAGGKLNIPEGTFIAAAKMVMEAGEADANDNYLFRYPQLVANGTLNVTGNKIYYDYLLNRKQQYPLCLPTNVTISDITYADGASAEYGKDFKFAVYDGAARANGASGWQYLAGNATALTAGVGYTVFATPQYYQYQGTGSLVQATYSRLRLPLNISADYTEAEKQVSVQSYPATKNNDAGWNLVGNPYFAEYSNVGGLTNNGIGLLTIQGSGYVWTGDLRYVVIPTDNGKAYSSELASSAKLKAFKNFFVQIGTGDALIFSLANRAQNAPMRMLTTDETNELMLGIRLNGAQSQDNMGVLIGENFTDAYEINADLQKFGHNAGVNVYAYMQNSELAYVAVNETRAQNAIPVGFIAPNAGEYTFAIDENYDLNDVESVVLYDSELKTTTNLKNANYTFTANKGTNNTRFILSVNISKKMPTSFDEMIVPNQEGKFIQNGVLYIQNKGKVYNAQGTNVK